MKTTTPEEKKAAEAAEAKRLLDEQQFNEFKERHKLTDKQLADLSNKHGGTFTLKVEDKMAILRKPNRKDVSMMRTLSQGDEIYAKELLMDAVWLAGDEELRTEDDYFLNAITILDQLVAAKVVELKKN